MRLGFLAVEWTPRETSRGMEKSELTLQTRLSAAVRDLVDTVVSVHAAAEDLQGMSRELGRPAGAAVLVPAILREHADNVDTAARAMIVALLGAIGKAELVIALADLTGEPRA